MIVCSFEGALGSLPAKYRRDEEEILRVLDKHPLFSVFDATEHRALATTLVKMEKRGLLEYPKPQPEFPWIKAALTERARRILCRKAGA